MLAGIVLLAALYALDRFYYFKLLVGAIRRTNELEESPELSFQLTRRTTQSISQPHAATLMTLFYCLPGGAALGSALLLLLFV